MTVQVMGGGYCISSDTVYRLLNCGGQPVVRAELTTDNRQRVVAAIFVKDSIVRLAAPW